VPPQGNGRIDNPGAYSVLYLSDAAAGAIAEAFGRFPEWTPDILEGSPRLPGSVRALARYSLVDAAPICNLDAPKQLLSLDLKPSGVVSRDYTRTRAWARRIYDQRACAGVRWWSFYDSKWASFGLWDRSGITLEDVQSVTLDHPDLYEASRTIARRVHPHASRKHDA
jgi:hypothetical protein